MLDDFVRHGLEIALPFRRKSGSFYLLYALRLFLVISVTVISPLGVLQSW